MPVKKKKRACPFSSSTPRRKKTTKSFCEEWASKLAESDKGSNYNQEKWLKADKASEKPIETTAATKSREVPRRIKTGQWTFLKVCCSGREASRKTPGSGMLSILPGKCRTFRKCIE